MKTIRWGIIGCGDVTEVKSGPAFQKADNSTLVAVMRRDADRARDYARRHGVPRWHADAEDIIAAKDIDAVYIATRPDSHHDYVLRCAKAGKAVYVEKPMAMTYGQCIEMVTTCRSHGVPVFVAYYRRAMPYLLKVKELLDEGRIGRVCAVSTSFLERLPPAADIAGGALPWRLDPVFCGGGIFFDTVCHNFDLLDFLFGPVIEARGFPVNRVGAYTPPDTVTASYAFESGVRGSGTWCFAAERNAESNEIIGTEGSIVFHPFSFAPIRLIRAGQVTEFPIVNPPHVQQPLIQTIVDELNGKGVCPSQGVSAARTAWVVETILSGAYL
ncbi:Gfo/Idh/MocA family protein [Telmatospirillum siberiense]|uniref:Oxidoreductase n=1 Tax=Telmatospirillum siberiense TaxID=382514 RepID=A0A2N3PTI6_9PROT|nr:Gfo/Idh/MocA family oxidoreductase [Telmatospirillum siberiense]PKU23709.1 oxidoreductase [Telmatospirillum siberiense]